MIVADEGFCGRCGASLGGNRFCGQCGEPSSGAAIPTIDANSKYRNPKRGWIHRTIFAVGIVVCVLFGINFGRGFVQGFVPSFRASYSNASRSPAPQANTVSEPHHIQPERVFHIGQSIRVGYWTYKINSYRWSDAIINGLNFSDIDRPDGKFLAVNLTIENEDKSPSTFLPISLEDDAGRISTQSSAGDLQDDVFGILKTLNPGVPSTGWVIFDVAPERHYRVILPGGYESDKRAIVDLGNIKIASAAASGNEDKATQLPPCMVASRGPMGIMYQWADNAPACDTQPAYLRQTGMGSTLAAAVDNYQYEVDKARATSQEDLQP